MNHLKPITFIVIALTSFIKVPGQTSSTDTIDLDEVVVTGSKVEVTRTNIPFSVSVIRNKEIEQSDESEILPVISEQVPGVFVTQRGITGFGVSDGAAGQINIRGLGGNPTVQTLILIDGHPQFMGLMGHPLPDAYATSDVSKVEVIRGPASVLYGSNAYGGVINIITKKQLTDGASLNLKSMYGSFDTRKISLSGGFRKKGFSVYASVNHDQTDGHRDSSDFSLTNSYIKAGYNFNSKLKIVTDFSLAGFKSADPGFELGVSGDTIDIQRGKAAISFENNYLWGTGAVKFYYNFGDHTITDGWHSVDEMFGLMIYQSFKPFEGNTVTLGYDYMDYGGKGSPIISVIRDENGAIIPGPYGPQFVQSEYNDKWISMNNNAVYTNIQQAVWTKIWLNAGLRYEINRTFGNEVIPEAGISYILSDKSVLKGSVSKGYRPPSIRELYLFPPANEKLNPEKMINYEAGWIQKWNNDRINTELTVYHCEGDNRIISVPSAPPPPPIYKNSGSFSNTGIELSVKYQPVKRLNFNINYAYIHMEEPLPATPEQNLFFSGNYNIGRTSFNLHLQQIANLYGTKSYEVEIIEKSYTILGAKIKYQATSFLYIFASGDNLLNQKYVINYGYPMPGVNFMLGLNLNLNKEF